MEYKGKHDIYDGPKEGLFGQTDRTTGEYRFRSGNVQQIYSDARYVPADESYIPPRYYRPAAAVSKKRKKFGLGFFAVLALCLACAILGGVFGSVIMSRYYMSSLASESAGGSHSVSLSTTVSDSAGSIDYAGMTDEVIGAAAGNEAQASASGDSVNADAISSVYTPGEIYTMACRQTVVINTEYSYSYGAMQVPSVVSGSGFVISENGLVLTNYHVVEKAVKNGCVPTVSFNDGSSYDAKVVEYSVENDVAVLKIDKSGLEPVTLGDSDGITVGDTIYVVGDPNGVLKFTQTTGHVCALDRTVATETSENGIKMFQIDASVYNGNSGGPVYNENGEVIGIVTAKYGDGESGGIGFAIPINDVLSVISDCASEGTGERITTSQGKADMGMNFDMYYSTAASRYFDLPAGAFVSSVEYAGPAYMAGLEPGDVVVSIGESDIGSCEEVDSVLELYRPGDTVEIHIWRNGRMYSAQLTFDSAH